MIVVSPVVGIYDERLILCCYRGFDYGQTNGQVCRVEPLLRLII